MKNLCHRIRSRCLPATKYDLDQLEKRIMATLQDLDDEITQDLEAAAKGIEDAIVALEGHIQQTPDTQPQIDHIKAIASALRSAAQGATDTVTVPPAPTP